MSRMTRIDITLSSLESAAHKKMVTQLYRLSEHNRMALDTVRVMVLVVAVVLPLAELRHIHYADANQNDFNNSSISLSRVFVCNFFISAHQMTRIEFNIGIELEIGFNIVFPFFTYSCHRIKSVRSRVFTFLWSFHFGNSFVLAAHKFILCCSMLV